ncbi:MAG: pyridoxamine 5'-phosphate oxidase family protein [Streptosporangiales bacterium]|nr:pyridoxamine 5'-phosphate oxidase family protein [Streptosporangiales bacterium]
MLDREECLRLLSRAPAGRLVFTERALPAIRPVNFVVHDGAIIIRSSEGEKLTAAADGAVVAFEADEIDVAARTGWSVIVVGQAAVVTDAGSVAKLSALPLVSWAPSSRDRFIRVDVTHVTGRRAVPATR